MKHIGFIYKTVNGRAFLIEWSDVQRARGRSVREMQQMNSPRKFCIPGQNLGQPWNNAEATGIKVPTGHGSRLIIFHAGTKTWICSECRIHFPGKK